MGKDRLLSRGEFDTQGISNNQHNSYLSQFLNSIKLKIALYKHLLKSFFGLRLILKPRECFLNIKTGEFNEKQYTDYLDEMKEKAQENPKLLQKIDDAKSELQELKMNKIFNSENQQFNGNIKIDNELRVLIDQIQRDRNRGVKDLQPIKEEANRVIATKVAPVDRGTQTDQEPSKPAVIEPTQPQQVPVAPASTTAILPVPPTHVAPAAPATANVQIPAVVPANQGTVEYWKKILEDRMKAKEQVKKEIKAAESRLKEVKEAEERHKKETERLRERMTNPTTRRTLSQMLHLG